MDLNVPDVPPNAPSKAKKKPKYKFRDVRYPVDQGCFQFKGNVYKDQHINETFNMGGMWWNVKTYISKYKAKKFDENYPDSTDDFLSVELTSKHEPCKFPWRVSFWGKFYIKGRSEAPTTKEAKKQPKRRDKKEAFNKQYFLKLNTNQQKIVIKRLVPYSGLELVDGVYTLVFTFLLRNLKYVETTSFNFKLPQNFLNADPNDAVIVKVQGRPFHVSKGYLSIYSGYFLDLFAKNPNLNEFEVDLVKQDEFKELLKSIYPSRKRIKSSDAEKFLHMADVFEIKAIRAEIHKLLLSRKCRLSLLGRMTIADKYNFPQLKVRILKLADCVEKLKKLLVESLKADTYEMVKRKYDRLMAIKMDPKKIRAAKKS